MKCQCCNGKGVVVRTTSAYWGGGKVRCPACKGRGKTGR